MQECSQLYLWLHDIAPKFSTIVGPSMLHELRLVPTSAHSGARAREQSSPSRRIAFSRLSNSQFRPRTSIDPTSKQQFERVVHLRANKK